MARRNLSAVVRYLRQLTGSANGNGADDADLLERYLRNHDEAAFELLLWRHGALVYNVCRRVLPREQDAEDAFQATFLAFVRKANSIHRRDSVASWLYKVAYRIALAAKERTRKTAAVEHLRGETQAIQPAADRAWSEVRPLLDEELNRLPERLRRPIVLCYLEGKSNAEAAREIGCRLGTIYSRLSRGRELLRRRLQRRGVTLSVTALTAVLTECAVEASPTSVLARAAARAAFSFADPSAATVIPPRVTTLAEGVLRTMFVTKLKIAALMLFVMSLAAGSVLTYARTAAPTSDEKTEKTPPKPAAGDKNAKDEPIVVKVVQPKKGGMPLMVGQQAVVQAAQQQQVVPLVSGTIEEVRVDIGDRVKKGATLIVLDAPLLAKEREQAASAFEMAQAEEREAMARVVIAEAEIEAADAQHKVKVAEKEAARGGAVTLAQRRVVEAAADAARVEVNIKKAKLEHAKAALMAAQAATRNARIALEKAAIQVGYTEIKAAFDGVVTRRTIDAGNYVQPSDSRLLRPLLTVQRLDSVRLVFRIQIEDQASLIKRGMPVEVVQSGVVREYKISRFAPTLEDRDGMAVEIDVPNPDNRFLAGMAITVGLPFQQTSAKSLILPRNCVFVRDGRDGKGVERCVYIVNDGKAYRKSVEIGTVNERNVEITSGISESALVILDATQKDLADGTPVKIEKTP